MNTCDRQPIFTGEFLVGNLGPVKRKSGAQYALFWFRQRIDFLQHAFQQRSDMTIRISLLSG
jgi:hypothetical protein